MTSAKRKTIVLMGPTASGKTGLAVQLARQLNGEIISADSRQVFTGMDIGSGKDLAEYQEIPYHLIDIRSAGADFSVSDFQEAALQALEQITCRNALPIICGGTGHYIKALLEDYAFASSGTNLKYTESLEKLDREELYAMLHELGLWTSHHWESDSKRRMARTIEKAQGGSPRPVNIAGFQQHFLSRLYFIDIERKQLRERIKIRLHERIAEGMIEETETLLASGIPSAKLERYGLEYKWTTRLLKGEISQDEMVAQLLIDIGRFAKRQMTFIRYMQRSGHHFHPITDFQSFASDVSSWLRSEI